MNSIYLGDRQLEEPDDEFECPYCGIPFTTKHTLGTHMHKCPKNDDSDLNLDYPE